MPTGFPVAVLKGKVAVLWLAGLILLFAVRQPATAQDVAGQLRRLEEADRQRQEQLEQLQQSNQVLHDELQRLRERPAPVTRENGQTEEEALTVQYESTKAGPSAPESTGGGGQAASRPAGQAGYTRLGVASPQRDGFFIRNADDTFLLRVHNRLQMRYTYDHFFDPDTRNGVASLDRQNDRSDFHIAREYLTFLGNAWSQDLYYQVTLEAFTAIAETARLRYSWIDYNVLHGLDCADNYSPWRNALNFRAGLWKSWFGREFNASDGELQFVDRSLATQAYNAGRVRGLGFFGSLVYCSEDRNPETGQTSGPGRFAYFVEIIDSINNATQAYNLDNSPESDPARFPRRLDTKPTLTTRWQYDLCRAWYTYTGANGQEVRANDFRFNEANDLAYHEGPALQIGASYIYQPNDFDAQPADNPLQGRFFKGKHIHRYGADVAFKYRGFSLTAEYYGENIRARPDSPFSTLNFATGAPIPPHARFSQESHGFYVRGGCFVVPRKLELMGRASGVFNADLALPSGGPLFAGLAARDAWEYTLGLGYYPTSHHYLKFQMECSYVPNNPISAEKGEFTSATRESDLIVRAQLQVEF